MNPQQLVETAEAIVRDTLSGLPPEIREAMRNVRIDVERTPSRADIEAGIEPDTLGFFDEAIEGMPRIRLWVDCIWDYSFHEMEIFEEEVETTLLHEIGHLVGWDEEDLEARGLD